MPAMLPTRLPDGKIRTMKTVGGGPTSGLIGDAVVILKPGDDGYAKVDAWLKSRGK
jgi:hypothetical protein